MKYSTAAFLCACYILLAARGAYAYHTNGVIVSPVPHVPGWGVMMVNDYFGGSLFNKVKMKIYSIDGEEVSSGMWPGYPAYFSVRNSSGDRLDPGVYTMKVDASNIVTGLRGTKTVKLLASGGSNGSFTRGGWVGARYIAMGRNGEVTANDVYSIYWNPAGLTELRHTQLITEKEIKEKAKEGRAADITERDLIKFSEEEKSFSAQIGLSGTMLPFGNNTSFFGMAVNLPKGVLGLGVYSIYSGDISRRDYNGVITGNLDYIGTAVYLSYGVSLGVSSFGFSLKGLYEKIGNTSFVGCGADVGTQVYVLPFLKVGLMLQDLGTGMYPLNKRYDIRERYNFAYPTLRLGIAVITNRNFTLAVSGIKKLDQKSFGYSIGAQYDIMKWASVYIGMQNLVFSAGFTFHIVQFDVSYAFTMDTINKGFNHNVSAAVLF
jgi:hypothetical protein